MINIPGLKSDVCFGDPDKPLPDWREVLPEETGDDDEPSEDERKAVHSMLGFDPSELDDSPEKYAQSLARQVGEDRLQWQLKHLADRYGVRGGSADEIAQAIAGKS